MGICVINAYNARNKKSILSAFFLFSKLSWGKKLKVTLILFALSLFLLHYGRQLHVLCQMQLNPPGNKTKYLSLFFIYRKFRTPKETLGLQKKKVHRLGSQSKLIDWRYFFVEKLKGINKSQILDFTAFYKMSHRFGIGVVLWKSMAAINCFMVNDDRIFLSGLTIPLRLHIHINMLLIGFDKVHICLFKGTATVISCCNP